MRIVSMTSKVLANDGKLYPLFAVVDQEGRTIIQLLSMKQAQDLLRDL